MAQDQVEEIKAKTDIVEFISEYVDLKRSGRNFKALCPFHSEKTPSFMVSPELGIFKCFGCSRGGDCYTFLQEYEKIDFPQALKILADRAGVKLKPLKGWKDYQEKDELFRANSLAARFYNYLLTAHKVGEKALSYLKKRGITDEAREVFELGYAPDRPDALSRFLTKKGFSPEALEKTGLVIKKQGKVFDRFRDRVVFPLHDHFGSTVGFAGRVLEDKGDVAKYINTPDTPIYKKGRLLYGLHLTKPDIKERGHAVVVEGELDAISSWQAKVRNVVAVKGSSLTEEQLTLLSRFCQQLRVATDADLAGDQAARRAIEEATNKGVDVRIVRLKNFKDPDEAAQKDPRYWKKAVEKAQGAYDFLIDSALERFDPETAEGKAKISRTLSPILAGVEDEILRAHLVKKVAEGLAVREEAVFAQVQKQQKPSARQPQEEVSKKQKPRRELLEEYLITLALQYKPELLQKKEFDGLIKSPAASRLVSQWISWAKGKKELDPSQFAHELPGELLDLYARLLLVELGDRFEDPQVLEKEIEKLKNGLEIIKIKEEMVGLSEQIKVLEKEGKARKLKKLEREFAQFSQKLVKLEATP